MIDSIQPDAVLEQYGNLVYQLALVQTSNQADAEDIFQEVFLRLVRKKPVFENNEHLKAWLIRVTINCSHSLWRSAWKQKVISLDEDLQTEDYNTTDLTEQVMKLPQKYRTVIHLFYYEDMPIETIAKSMGIRYSAAAKCLSRARQLLKTQLTKEENYDDYTRRVPKKC